MSLIKKNSFHSLTISTLSPHGIGIGYLKKIPVYVANTVPGDMVAIKLIKVEKKRLFAKLCNIITPSADRVKPRCDVAHLCGGCQLQHITFQSQLQFKQNILIHQLSAVKRFDPAVLRPFISLDDPWHFRNKMQFSFAKGPDGSIQIGLYASRSHRVVDTNQCPIASSIIQQTLRCIKQWSNTESLSVFNEKTGKGLLRFLTIRCSTLSNEQMIILTIGDDGLDTEAFVDYVTQELSLHSIFLSQQNDPTSDMVLGSNLSLLWGKPAIADTIFNIHCHISPQSFVQSNSLLVSKLYDYIINSLSIDKNQTIFDLYCGIGILTTSLAKHGFHAIGIDSNASAIQDAEKNALLNASDVTFITEDVIHFLRHTTLRPAAIIIDPPRQGCEKVVLDLICKIRPHQLIYVSCNPVTLARDLSLLVDAGFQISIVQPVDMFCHSYHLEVVVSGNF